LLISGFGRGTNNICALLESYTAWIGNSVPTFLDNLSIPLTKASSPRRSSPSRNSSLGRLDPLQWDG